jgi:hypothetical protein
MLSIVDTLNSNSNELMRSDNLLSDWKLASKP